jgi:hypothetical protein
VHVYKPLTASVSGDLNSSPEDLVGMKYSISAPAVTPDELAETRHREGGLGVKWVGGDEQGFRGLERSHELT